MSSNLALESGFLNDPLFWVYSVGSVLMTIVGYIVQLKYIKFDDTAFDDFTRQHNKDNLIIGESSWTNPD